MLEARAARRGSAIIWRASSHATVANGRIYLGIYDGTLQEEKRFGARNQQLLGHRDDVGDVNDAIACRDVCFATVALSIITCPPAVAIFTEDPQGLAYATVTRHAGAGRRMVPCGSSGRRDEAASNPAARDE